MLKLGVTGGIGSGKSIVCRIFRELCIPVYSADIRARVLTEKDSSIREKVISLLGSKAYTGNVYNRKYVSEIVFSDKGKLADLNAIIHPAVDKDFQDWLKASSKSPYVVKEAAILFESGANKKMDFTIYIDAPTQLRIKRVMKRDKLSEENVMSRIQNQSPADKIKSLADRTIENTEKQLLLPQVLEIHNTLKKRSISHG